MTHFFLFHFAEILIDNHISKYFYDNTTFDNIYIYINP